MSKSDLTKLNKTQRKKLKRLQAKKKNQKQQRRNKINNVVGNKNVNRRKKPKKRPTKITNNNNDDDDDDDCIIVEKGSPENKNLHPHNKMIIPQYTVSVNTILGLSDFKVKPSTVTTTSNADKTLDSVTTVTSAPLFQLSEKVTDMIDTESKKTEDSQCILSETLNNTTISETSRISPELSHKDNESICMISEPSVILLETSTASPKVQGNHHNNQNNDNDDSVIFVGENECDDCVLVSVTKSDKIRGKKKKFLPKPFVKPKNQFLSAKDQKVLQRYNSNAYNPDKETTVTTTTSAATTTTTSTSTSSRRKILIDGSNVAYHHSLNKEFSVKGLKICIEYFEKRGHDVKAVVPQYRLKKSKSSDPELLDKLFRENKIVYTPCKSLPGLHCQSYDDRFILQLAVELDAAIISNDNYRDLINENQAFKKIIENRVIGYTWCNDIFILPKDPYGRLGPSLSTILNEAGT